MGSLKCGCELKSTLSNFIYNSLKNVFFINTLRMDGQWATIPITQQSKIEHFQKEATTNPGETWQIE
jgi:hypothetical protein